MGELGATADAADADSALDSTTQGEHRGGERGLEQQRAIAGDWPLHPRPSDREEPDAKKMRL